MKKIAGFIGILITLLGVASGVTTFASEDSNSSVARVKVATLPAYLDPEPNAEPVMMDVSYNTSIKPTGTQLCTGGDLDGRIYYGYSIDGGSEEFLVTPYCP